jgi:hypothetical protein
MLLELSSAREGVFAFNAHAERSGEVCNSMISHASWKTYSQHSSDDADDLDQDA